MVNQKISRHPTICYRPIKPSDMLVLQQLHADLFPIRYESEFFQNVVNAREIVSWGAVDRSRRNGCSDELIGFVTSRIVLANESEIGDLLSYDSSKSDQTLVYILTLGVVESYRNLGIAASLISEVIKYASSISTCHAVYLHVISYNLAAIQLYKKMSFKCVRRLYGFYLINGQHYDSYLFVYYVNGGRSPCAPLELVTVAMTYLRRGLKSVAARLRKNEEKWLKCKESRGLVATQSRRNLTTECSGHSHKALPLKPLSSKLWLRTTLRALASGLTEVVTNDSNCYKGIATARGNIFGSCDVVAWIPLKVQPSRQKVLCFWEERQNVPG